MTAPTAQDDFEVWFLTGSQHLYGEETLRQVAEQSRGIAAVLSEAPSIRAKLIWKPVLTDHDAIRRTVLEANADDRVIGLVAWMHTFSPAKMWIAGLSALDKPLLHLHTQANVALPWADIDFGFMNLNQAAHGDRELGYILARLGVRHKTVTGHAGSASLTRRAGAGWRRRPATGGTHRRSPWRTSRPGSCAPTGAAGRRAARGRRRTSPTRPR